VSTACAARPAAPVLANASRRPYDEMRRVLRRALPRIGTEGMHMLRRGGVRWRGVLLLAPLLYGAAAPEGEQDAEPKQEFKRTTSSIQ